MSESEKHQEFLRELTKLLDDFHDKYPDLLIAGIDLELGTYPSRRQRIIGVRVEIKVQPAG
jgi:hypothetical protein